MPYNVWKENNTIFVKYKVRNYHIDSYGHINNAVYLQFLEDARTDFFSYLGHSLSFLAKNNIFVFITEINIKYLNPAFLDDIIVVTGNIVKISKVRATWLQEIYKDDKKLVSAHVTGAFLNGENKILRIPDYVLKGMESIKIHDNNKI